MAIELKELLNREYEGSKPIRFEYSLKNQDGDEILRVLFSEADEKIWRLLATVDKSQERDTMVYDFNFEMPPGDFDACKIAAFGMYALKEMVQFDIGVLMGIDFMAGDALAGMLA